MLTAVYACVCVCECEGGVGERVVEVMEIAKCRLKYEIHRLRQLKLYDDTSKPVKVNILAILIIFTVSLHTDYGFVVFLYFSSL